MAGVRSRFAGQGFSAQAITSLCAAHLRPSATNRTYLAAQRRFVYWCHTQSIDVNRYTPPQLINFLALVHADGFSPNTVILYKSAVAVFHVNSSTVTQDPTVRAYLRRILRDAPPRETSQPLIDLTPSINFVGSIDSSPSTPLSLLNRKAAFLLAMAAFLRPSDLHRIDLSRCSISEPDGLLHLVVVAPKETRQGRRIVKTLTLHPLEQDPTLCPVRAFTALRDHPDASSRPQGALFVNSTNPTAPLSVVTISLWLRNIVRKSCPDIGDSTSRSPMPSIRSLASDRALSQGASLQDIVVMGNWSTSTVFDNHYRRQRQVSTNISARAILGNSAVSEDA
ncbi:hypothetical protein BCR43DRAFT_447177 [Syncephalastrum racemosum]|uniref:Tyr recombinase domain-containing protein n=1 Tax=Syncephalastrum racemosum TaxID=13706 RepID=A0A1X2H0M1_SYNRA|nr:hypothetical protein BCR43DRAFT_447177 [Syncephalastrum racemosum]